MEFAYFPGCAGHSTARDQDLSTRELFTALGIRLNELPDWNCCGATPGHTIGGDLSTVLSLKNLGIAADTEQALLVPCASCFGNLKRTAQAASAGKIPKTIASEAVPLPGRPVDVLSIVSVLMKAKLLDKIKELRTGSLSTIRVAPYYGCLLLRPEEETGAEDAENPKEMETIIAAAGAIPVEWPHKTDCCGGPNTVSHPETVSALSGKLVEKARQFGADLIATACPMCHAGLDCVQWESRREHREGAAPLPILYLTELVAAAIGVKRQSRWLKRHLIDPRPFLKAKGALT